MPGQVADQNHSYAQLEVVAIQLAGYNPNPIPACLKTLTRLNFVSLTSSGGGGWSGPINSVQWASLQSLQTLALQGNLLAGPFPATMPASIQFLSFNSVTGLSNSILSLSSVFWMNNTALTSLIINYNVNLALGATPGNAIPAGLQTLSIVGTISPIMGPMSLFSWQKYTALQSLAINNILSGPIPPTFGNFSQLISLDLSSNALTGSVAAANWGSMPILQTVLLSWNQFSTWDNAFSSGPSTLQSLAIVQTTNSITGMFSDELLSLPSLTSLDIGGNGLLDYNIALLCTHTWNTCNIGKVPGPCAYVGSFCTCSSVPMSSVCSNMTTTVSSTPSVVPVSPPPSKSSSNTVIVASISSGAFVIIAIAVIFGYRIHRQRIRNPKPKSLAKSAGRINQHTESTTELRSLSDLYETNLSEYQHQRRLGTGVRSVDALTDLDLGTSTSVLMRSKI